MGLCMCTERDKPVKPTPVISQCTQAFKLPAIPLGVGGGSGPSSCPRLYRLVPVRRDFPEPSGEDLCGTLQDDCCGCTGKHCDGNFPAGELWLGKETTGCLDELDFYDAVLRLRQRRPTESASDWWRILDYVVEYCGLLRDHICQVPGSTGHFRERPQDLLVFRSPLQGFARPRLLHLEIGPRSSALQQRRTSDLDTAAFARQEGLRIDNFLAPPRSVAAEDPTLDTRGWAWGDTTQRRGQRACLQRLTVVGALAAMIDLRDAISEERLWPSETTTRLRTRSCQAHDTFLSEFLSSAEYSELALLAIIKELCVLWRACGDVPLPQKWVGSSLALLVEIGAAPPRSGGLDPWSWVLARVKLRLFGWSRSRLSANFPGHYMSILEQQDNEFFWQIYTCSLCWTLWEASRLYLYSHCTQEWRALRFDLIEVSTLGEELLVGTVETATSGDVPIRCSLPLTKTDGSAVVNDSTGQQSTLSIAVAFVTLPPPSRFRGAWRVHVDGACQLPSAAAAAAATDDEPRRSHSRRGDGAAAPSRRYLVAITARGVFAGTPEGLDAVASFRTAVAKDKRSAGPSWKEDFELLVANEEDAASGALYERLAGALAVQVGTQADTPRAAGDTGSPDDSKSVVGRRMAPAWLRLLPPPGVQESSTSTAAQDEDTVRIAAAGQLDFAEFLQRERMHAVDEAKPPEL